MSFRVVIDSCGELTDEMKASGCFETASLMLQVDDHNIIDDESFDQADFLRRVAASPNCPKSSCPSPEAYRSAFDCDADHIFAVTLSAKLSGSYNSAVLGMNLLKEEKPLLMVLEDLQDPGNAGTIIRTGEGAGVSGVFLTKTCVDITNPKVIRATMGSVYRIPFFYVEDVVSLKQKLQGREIRFFAAHLQGKNSYDRESYEDGTAFLIGNEGKGLTDQAADAADCLIRIPMCGQVESLNAAMAAGILMYEAARQRRG